MDSDLHNQRQQQPQKQQQGQQVMNSGLTRYRSAPSSYFSNLINSGMYEEEEDVDPFFNPRAPSPETERILSRFISSGGGGDNSSSHQNTGQIVGNDPPFMDSMKQERVNFSYQSQQQQQMIYQNHAQCQQADRNNNSVVSGSSSAIVDPLVAMDPPTNLLRQSSSPAGFFEHVNIDSGYSMMTSMDKFRTANDRAPGRMTFSSGAHSSSRSLSLIPENQGKTVGISGAHNNGGFGQTHPRAGNYGSSFPSGSWDQPAMLNDDFMKDLEGSDGISSSENQNDEGKFHSPTALSHQMSLPTSSSELSVIEKLLQFQETVPLRSRAKRGCATHPRSIAERVRRTRISERIRKLQDLVPDMDKQTNTADMLDLAVDYIKELQKQVEKLSDHHANCTCPHKQEL